MKEITIKCIRCGHKDIVYEVGLFQCSKCGRPSNAIKIKIKKEE